MIGTVDLKRRVAAGGFLALAALMPAQPASAQNNVLGGAIVGGAVGGIVGGAVGRGAGGAVVGAVIGATAGAAIAAEAERRKGGYYWWHGGCYYRYPNGSYLHVQPGYCSY
jgi:outer membrane lipoprotein SlyB